MPIRFQDQLGRRERHLARRHLNPLFVVPLAEIGPDTLAEARRHDQQDAIEFHQRFRTLVRRAAELSPNEPSERVLELKSELEKAYEEAAGLGDDHSHPQKAIGALIEAIMRAVWQGARDDPLAHHELEQEESSRSLHFALLEYPLITDLLHPDSPIAPDELVPTLLSAPADALDAALQLFDAEQIAALSADARRLLGQLRQEGYELPQAWARLAQIEASEARTGSSAGVN